MNRPHRCRLEIRGSPSAGVAADIDRRFGATEVLVGRQSTVLEVQIRDQAALRGLLTLLWDHNHEVLGLRIEDARPS